MDFEKLWNLPAKYRTLLVALLFALVVILILVDINYFRPGASETLKIFSIYTEAFTAALLVSLLMLVLFSYFLPKDVIGDGFQQIPPTQITNEFQNLLNDTRRWRYRGNFGRYCRGKVLPTLATRPGVDIDVSIIDPMNNELCEKHAKYRNEIPAIDKGRNYNSDTVALEVAITIIHLAWYRANKKVDIDLFLSAVFDPIRIDANDEAMILTVEDRRSPALRISKENFWYEHFESQMRYAQEQAKRFDLTGLRVTATIAALTEKDISDYLSAHGMKSLCERLTAAAILEGCRSAKNPYEN